MKQFTKQLRWLLASLMLVVGMSAWAEDVTDILTADKFTATNTTYKDFSGVTITSDAVYAGNSAKTSSGGIQLRSKNSSGIVSTTSGGKLKSVKITVESGSNTVDVYGNTTAYTSAADLYSNSKGTKLGSVSATGTITVSGDYQYVGIRSNNNALYLTRIEIVWEVEDTGDTRTETTVEFPASAYSFNLGETFTSPVATLTPAAAGSVTYASSKESVATVDASTGALTLVAAGTTTITATFAETTQYKGSHAQYTLTVVDPNANDGSEEHPYTVAEARAAIDAGTGITGVYVKGIVSEIVTAYNSQYGNITYNITADGTTDGDFLQAYRGKSYNGDNFTSADDIQVGDEVVVKGNLTLYGSTYELAQGNVLVSNSRTAPDTRTETHITFYQGANNFLTGKALTLTEGDSFENVTAYVTIASGAMPTDATGAITYKGDNDALGTVHATTGSITWVDGATGTLTVTATFAGDDTYKPCEGYYTVTVNPAEVTPTGTGDEITYNVIGVTGTSYTDWSGKTGASGAVYAGNTAGGSSAVQMRSSNSSGIVTTKSPGKATMVTVEWAEGTSNGRTLDIYGSNTAYESAADLYDSSKRGTKLGSIVYGTSTQLVITGDYAYIGIRSNNGALWCDKITIYWDTPTSTEVATTTTIDATDLTNTDVNAGTNAGTLTATVMAGATAVSGATVTWESSNTEVATIDTEGVVTLVAAGSTTITATYAGVTDQYQSSSDTYELTVTNSSVTPGDELFNETFAGFEGSGGRDDVYSGSVGADSTSSTDEEGWTFDKCGGASSSLKFGTGNANGVFTTRSIALTGDGTLTFSAAGWGSGTNTLAVTAEGGDVPGNTDITLENGEWKDYTVNITGATGSLVLTFTGKRGFIDDIKVVSAAPDERTATTITLTPATESYNVILGDAFTAPTAELDPAAAGTLTYESSDEDVAEVAANGAVTIKAAGTTTITAKFAGSTDYKPSQAAYTIVVTAPATVYTSLQQLQENVTSTSQEFTLQPATDIYVTALKGTNNAYISDGTYGALIFTNNHGLTAGQKFTGTLSAKFVLYKGATEITNFDATGLTITDGTLAVQTKTIGEITVANQSLPVKFENVTYDAENTQFTDGTNTIKYYNNFGISPAPTLEDGHIYDITGIIVMYNNLQIAPLAATDVVDVTPAATVEAPVFDPAGGTYTEDKTVTITCATAGAAIYYTLDGTDPTTASTLYTEPVAITTTTTLKAIASDGTNVSTVTTATYTINKVEKPYALNYCTEYYTKVTDLDQLENGDAVIIVSDVHNFAMSTTQQANNRKEVEFEWVPWIGGSFAQLDASSTIEKFIVVKEGEYFYFYASRGTKDGYIYMAGANNNSNYLRTQTTKNNNAKASVEVDANGNATIIFQGTDSKNTLMYNSSAGLFSCYSSGQQPVQIYVEGSTADVEALKSVTTKAVQDNYMTFVTPYDARFDGVNDHAYIVTLSADQKEANLKEVYVVPAGTPIIYKYETAGKHPITRAISGSDVLEDVRANVLKVSRGEVTGNGTVFVLNKVNNVVGFYRLNEDRTLACGKCYLTIEKSSGVKFIGFNVDDVATGIETVESTMDKVQGTIYDLQGRRVTTPAHGLYIVNGKKVFIK